VLWCCPAVHCAERFIRELAVALLTLTVISQITAAEQQQQQQEQQQQHGDCDCNDLTTLALHHHVVHCDVIAI